jgi:MoxR-like ATPase
MCCCSGRPARPRASWRAACSACCPARTISSACSRASPCPKSCSARSRCKALEDDRYERLTEGYLPSAEVAFLDEVFKANSAILNTLLGLLHERQFDNGSQRLPVPLVCLVGASNEQPQDDSLLAFYDRFLLRVPVQPVDDAHFAALLQPRCRPRAHPADADQPAAAGPARAAPLGRLGGDALACCSRPATRQRTGKRCPTAAGASWPPCCSVQAASRGAREVSPWDLWLLPFVLAADPAQVPGWTDWFLHAVAHTEPLPLDGPGARRAGL